MRIPYQIYTTMYTLFCIRMSEQRACYHFYVVHTQTLTNMLNSLCKDAMYAILTQTHPYST